jgi:hypothetical protein
MDTQTGMSEPLKVAITAFAVIVVFVIGEIVGKWLIEPIQNQRKMIGEVAYVLKFYANYDAEITSKDLLMEGMIKIRCLSGELDKSLVLIPCYRLLSLFRVIPKRETILAVGSLLIGTSNSLGTGPFGEGRAKITKLLKIEHLVPE